MAIPTNPNRSAQRGVGLLEVLITALVLAVGLLGMAGLQIKSNQFNHAAYVRSQANILAYDIVDRMRANRALAKENKYNIALGAAAGSGSMATQDLAAWKAQLAGLLPKGDGSVACSIINTITNCNVIITWREPSQKADEADLQLSYKTNL